MTDLLLTRYGSTPFGTFGVLSMASGFVCHTVEKPWLDNRPWVSCIPDGRYVLQESTFVRGGYVTYEVMDVWERNRILVHAGNTSDDVQGCIALGSSLGCVRGKWAVIRSRRTLNEWLAAMRDEDPPFQLTIEWGRYGTDG